MVVCDPRKETSQIIYGDFGMDSTVVTKFNLICDDQFEITEWAIMHVKAHHREDVIGEFSSDSSGEED